jgi:hypothetical protein
MKKSDWALIILIVLVVGVISYFVIGSILPDPEDETVKTAPEITASISAPTNNVMLYMADRPSWCPNETDDSVSSKATDEEDKDNEEENSNNKENNDNPDESSSNKSNANNESKQAINASFNSCAINSSFTTTTE